MNLTSLDKLSKLRLSEAKILAKNNKNEGAIYLCGYAIELTLKRRICKVLDLREYPESSELRSFKTHDLDLLLKLAGLERRIKKDSKLWAKWQIVNKWKSELRYSTQGPTDAQSAISTTADIIRYINTLK